ncbi:MAG: TIGR00730 family Rossman fold protein [Phycisphaeraceae bacterium]|nr:TIGR00730 family Rossman fold protein [Phycisphaeraceae bacterium]
MNICVYCGSSTRASQAYLDVATDLGRRIAQRGHTLVYGGGNIGLMGQLARTVHQHGGKVLGVIPDALVSDEVAYRQADELIVTPDMRQRKDVMDKRSDAFITLPGGFGTLEELSEAITHRILGYHGKPIAIVNTAGFYDPLIALFDHFIEQSFAKPKHRDVYRIVPDAAAALAYVETTPFSPPSVTGG